MKTKMFMLIQYIRHWLQAKRRGHGIHSPFAYALCEEVFYNNAGFYEFEILDELRRKLLLNETILQVEDLGAGSHTIKNNARPVKLIAKKGISSSEQSKLIFRLINYLDIKTTIELGTSVGLNTLYMASANKKGKVFTIEGSLSLYEFAKRLGQNATAGNVDYIHGNFDRELKPLLQKLNNFDLMYIDGNHRKEATIRYFEEALPFSHNNSVLIFDDINWSKGMREAWHHICDHPSVRLSIDLYHMGMVFFREEIKEKVHLKMLL